MKLKKYIYEEKLLALYEGKDKKAIIAKAKKEVAKLKAWKKAKKLTDAGQRRLDKLENILFGMGIFDTL